MKLRSLLKKSANSFAALALFVGVVSTSATCRFFLHQPEVPEQMKELLKRKNQD